MRKIALESIRKAQQMGLIRLDGENIHYKNADFKTKLTPEENVRLECFLYLVLIKYYPPEWISFEHKIRFGTSFLRTDLILWKNAQKTEAFLILECKKADCTPKVWKDAQEQLFSYEKQLGAEYLWLSKKIENKFYKVHWQEKSKKVYLDIADIPKLSSPNLFWLNLKASWQKFISKFFDTHQM